MVFIYYSMSGKIYVSPDTEPDKIFVNEFKKFRCTARIIMLLLVIRKKRFKDF